jgi:hypothetical protein
VGSRRSPSLLGPFTYGTILASEVFKQPSWGTVGMMVVGEQAASPPTFSTTPAWTRTL